MAQTVHDEDGRPGPLSVQESQHSGSDVVYDDDSNAVQIVGPDWDTINRNVFGVEPADPPYTQVTAEQIITFGDISNKFFKWLWGTSPIRRMDGLAIRGAVLSKHFYRGLHGKSLDEVAAGIERNHKQSLGRAQDSLKRQFPHLPLINIRK